MTSIPHIAPLLLNPITKEPFIRLPPPHSNIILTPPRITDAQAIVSILNDERVYRCLEGPPFPYLMEHAKEWLGKTMQSTESFFKDVQEHPDKFVGGCPVRIIREVKDNGEDIYLGDCGAERYGWPEIEDGATRAKMVEENYTKVAGQEDIVWGIGDYLAPSHHGKGIMTAALKAIIEEWMIPRLGAKKIKTAVYKGNVGSLRVFEKNGFVIESTLEDWREIPENKGGGKVGLHVLCRQI